MGSALTLSRSSSPCEIVPHGGVSATVLIDDTPGGILCAETRWWVILECHLITLEKSIHKDPAGKQRLDRGVLRVRPDHRDGM